MKLSKNPLGIGILVSTTVVALSFFGFFFLATSGLGQRWVLDRVIDEVNGSLRGKVFVEDLRSDWINEGVRLVGVRGESEEGLGLFTIDSLDVNYSVFQLLRGAVNFSDIILWNPELTLDNDQETGRLNLGEFFDPPNPSHSLAEATLIQNTFDNESSIFLEGITIVDGRVIISPNSLQKDYYWNRLLPSQGLGGVGDDEGLELKRVEAQINKISIEGEETRNILMELDNLSLVVTGLQDSLEVTDFGGEVFLADQRLQVRLDRIRLGQSEATGVVALDMSGDRGSDLSLTLTSSKFDFDDLRWINPALPIGRGEGDFQFSRDLSGMEFRWDNLELDLGSGQVVANGAFSKPVGGVGALKEVLLDLSNVPLSSLQNYVPELTEQLLLSSQVPWEGLISGHLDLSGSMDAMAVNAGLTVTERGSGEAQAVVEGILHLSPPFGATDLKVHLDPLDMEIVNKVLYGSPFQGSVDFKIRADGLMNEGIEVAIEGAYQGDNSEKSRVVLEGIMAEGDGDIRVSLSGSLDPLVISDLVSNESLFSGLGVARGTVRIDGTATNMSVRTDMFTQDGELSLDTYFDLTTPLSRYRVVGRGRNFDAHKLVPQLPAGTVVTGSVNLSVEREGLGVVDLEGEIDLVGSHLGVLPVEKVKLSVKLSDSVLNFDTVSAIVGGVSLEGSGKLAILEDAIPQELHLKFESTDLEQLRPLWLGPDVIARDTLTSLSRDILILDGVNPDIFPLAEDIATEGQIAGQLVLSGSLQKTKLLGVADVSGMRYGNNIVEVAVLDFSATNLFTPRAQVDFQLDADSIDIMGRNFDSLSVRINYSDPRGELDLFLMRSEDENYQARIAFEDALPAKLLNIDELSVNFPDERWNLGGPSRVFWDSDGLTFEDFRLIRPGIDGLRIQTEGRFPFEGQGDLEVLIENLDVSRVSHLFRWDESLSGVIDLAFNLTGDDSNPQMRGDISVSDFQYRDYFFQELDIDAKYSDKELRGDITFGDGSSEFLSIEGMIPADLSIDPVQDRFLNEDIEVFVTAISAPFSLLMAPFDSYQEVEGTISGQVRFGGTLDKLSPNGGMTLIDGGAFAPGLGVRHENLFGTSSWTPDGVVEVEVRMESEGEAAATGRIEIGSIANPNLDLEVHLEEFRALDRRDVSAKLSGDFTIQGPYTRPVVTGDLFVDEGTLFVEEFQRAANVVDLLASIETTQIDLSTVLEDSNRFLENVRMENTTLTVQRNSWIRSARMNVELDGQLGVLWDRQTQELALVGELEALRGSYGALGRQFQVDTGTLRFLGTSGINPTMNISASNNVRSSVGDRFGITASVTGTLEAPRISLTSDQAGFTEDDLLSHLYFGRPTYALTSGQNQAVNSMGAILGSGATLGLSTFSNELGSAMAKELGVDYLSITQEDFDFLGNTSNTLGTTVVETGFYMTEDLFVTLLLRPLSSQGSGSGFAGLRSEWISSDSYTVESFFEDRFFRNRMLGFGELGFHAKKDFGLSIFREWIY